MAFYTETCVNDSSNLDLLDENVTLEESMMAILIWLRAAFAITARSSSKLVGIIIPLSNWEIFANFQADESCPKNHTALNLLYYFYYHIACERQSCIKL